MTWAGWCWLAGFTALVALLVLFGGCSRATPKPRSYEELTRMQREVQNCILEGGTPRLGPDRSILCLYP